MYRNTMALVAIAILLFACNTRQGQSPRLFRDIVDKQAQAYCDSLTELSHGILGSDTSFFLSATRKKIEQYPYSKDSASHATLALTFGNLYNIYATHDSAIKYAEEALIYFEKHPEYTKQLFTCYTLLGMSLNNTSKNTFKANYYCTKAALLVQKPGMDTLLKPTARSQALYLAANTNRDCEMMEQALRFARASYQLLQLKQNKKDPRLSVRTIRACNELAAVFTKLKEYDSARIYLDIAQRNNDIVGRNKNYQIDIENQKVQYYLAIKKYDSSLIVLVHQDNPNIDSDYLCMVANRKLQLYTLLRQPDSAFKNLIVAEQLIRQNKNNNEVIGFFRNRANYYALYGNREIAEQSLYDFDSVSQDFYRKDRLKMFSSIESEYNLADKQKSLNYLSSVNKAAENKIRQKNNLLLVSVLGLLLFTVVVISLLLLSRQRKLRSANQLIESQRDKMSLEQRLLRTQMEPHFIFNTLTVMQSMVRNQENEKAIVYLNKFARLLRTSLENSREDYVSVAEEIDALQDYISLQSVRFEGKFNYSLNAYDGYEDDEIKIPPMLLQPFVENAIYHGMKNISYKGIISIDISKTEHNLHCIIMDNGSGIIPNERTDHKSMAINITRERLEMVSKETGYPASFEVSGRDDDHSGTMVTLVIPYML